MVLSSPRSPAHGGCPASLFPFSLGYFVSSQRVTAVDKNQRRAAWFPALLQVNLPCQGKRCPTSLSASASEAAPSHGPAAQPPGESRLRKGEGLRDDDSWLITLARAGLNQLLSPVALPGLMAQGGKERGEIMRFPIQNRGGFIAVVITSAVSEARTRNHSDFQVPDLLNNKMKSQHKSPLLTQVAAVGSLGGCHTGIRGLVLGCLGSGVSSEL